MIRSMLAALACLAIIGLTPPAASADNCSCPSISPFAILVECADKGQKSPPYKASPGDVFEARESPAYGLYLVRVRQSASPECEVRVINKLEKGVIS